MNTTFKSPDEFQRAGDVCESCRPFWEQQGLEPMIMVDLGSATEAHGIPIVVCPRCDGDTILRLHKY